VLARKSRRTFRRSFDVVVLAAGVLLTACGGKSDSPSGVSLSGQVTFDLVPHFTDGAGLDYPLAAPTPARGVQVQLLDRAGTVLDSGITTEAGTYSLQAPAATDVRVRVEARMQRDGTPSWDFSVTDNTSGNALYVLDGQLVNSGREDSVRDLHAVSGWNGEDYAELRPAAPFAILDVVYEAVARIQEVDPAVNMPPLEIRWSTANTAVSGDKTQGAIGTTFYAIDDQSIYLLGWADNDTDEYDRSVIAHEFAHYLEYQLGRTDSVGGVHSLTSKLDMRVAFSEGWGSAFAAIATDDPFYRDSFGTDQQGPGLYYSLEENSYGNNGWYSENSVQKILYDLYDSNNEGADQLTLGFAPIYQTLTSDAWLQFAGATSIYPFVSQLKTNPLVDGQLVDDLLEAENITGTGDYGEGETNDSSIPRALPVYTQLPLGETLPVCSDTLGGEYNGVDVRRFVRFALLNSGSYDIIVERSDGLFPANPDFVLWQDGERLATADTGTGNREVLTRTLDADSWLEVYEHSNVDKDPDTGGSVCFNLSLSNAP
jgi:hypothetical protein